MIYSSIDWSIYLPIARSIRLSIYLSIEVSVGHYEKIQMSEQTLSKAIHFLLEKESLKESLLTPADIAKKLKKDKARVSGYLEAMADYGKVSVKKVGNGKVYFLNEKGK